MSDTARFSHLAGHTALDLANTVRWRLDDTRRDDTLGTYFDVLAWAGECAVIDADERESLTRAANGSPAHAERELSRFTALREGIHAAVDPGLAHPNAAGPVIHRDYAEAIEDATLAPSTARWAWTLPVDLRLPRLRMSFLAVDLLTSADRERMRQCDDDYCGWVFVDTSARHNRRWCDSADCGNRNRVRAHSERMRARQP
jgi:predicted RNA-binding Zn ribbon-like protein